MSSEDITDEQSGQRIGSRITPVFGGSGSTASHKEAIIPEWVMKGKTILIQKDHTKKELHPQPLIMCLFMMWKIHATKTRE